MEAEVGLEWTLRRARVDAEVGLEWKPRWG